MYVYTCECGRAIFSGTAFTVYAALIGSMHAFYVCIHVFLWFWIHTASAPITSGTHTDDGAVIRKPGSAWFEGTPAIRIFFHILFYDCCFEVDIRIRRYTNKRWKEQNTHEQEQIYLGSGLFFFFSHTVLCSFFFGIKKNSFNSFFLIFCSSAREIVPGQVFFFWRTRSVCPCTKYFIQNYFFVLLVCPWNGSSSVSTASSPKQEKGARRVGDLLGTAGAVHFVGATVRTGGGKSSLFKGA